MNLQPGQRVRILKPYWNKNIWGAPGTIQGDNYGMSDRTALLLDDPTLLVPRAGSPIGTVFVTGTEVEPLIPAKTSHTDWSTP